MRTADKERPATARRRPSGPGRTATRHPGRWAGRLQLASGSGITKSRPPAPATRPFGQVRGFSGSWRAERSSTNWNRGARPAAGRRRTRERLTTAGPSPRTPTSSASLLANQAARRPRVDLPALLRTGRRAGPVGGGRHPCAAYYRLVPVFCQSGCRSGTAMPDANKRTAARAAFWPNPDQWRKRRTVRGVPRRVDPAAATVGCDHAAGPRGDEVKRFDRRCRVGRTRLRPGRHEPDAREPDDAEAELQPAAAISAAAHPTPHPVPSRPQAPAADEATLDRLLNGLREV